jgi:carbon storage regulator CsrA
MVVIGDGIVITLLKVDGGRVRIGIEAPERIPVRATFTEGM